MRRNKKILIVILIALAIAALSASSLFIDSSDPRPHKSVKRVFGPSITFPFEGTDCTFRNHNGAFDLCEIDSDDIFRVNISNWTSLADDVCGNKLSKNNVRNVTLRSTGEFIVEDTSEVTTTLMYCKELENTTPSKNKPEDKKYHGKISKSELDDFIEILQTNVQQFENAQWRADPECTEKAYTLGQNPTGKNFFYYSDSHFLWAGACNKFDKNDEVIKASNNMYKLIKSKIN